MCLHNSPPLPAVTLLFSFAFLLPVVDPLLAFSTVTFFLTAPPPVFFVKPCREPGDEDTFSTCLLLSTVIQLQSISVVESLLITCSQFLKPREAHWKESLESSISVVESLLITCSQFLKPRKAHWKEL